MAIGENARAFFDACETGKGWEVCRNWCASNATFSAQTDALAEIDTLEGYVEWQKGLLVPVPNGHYELKAFAVDDELQTVVAAAVFHGTHTVDAGDAPPTGKTVAADYCYVMKFNGDKISHMTKIWNDGHSLKQLGWA
jgi:predicted ester cyclase